MFSSRFVSTSSCRVRAQDKGVAFGFTVTSQQGITTRDVGLVAGRLSLSESYIPECVQKVNVFKDQLNYLKMLNFLMKHMMVVLVPREFKMASIPEMQKEGRYNPTPSHCHTVK